MSEAPGAGRGGARAAALLAAMWLGMLLTIAGAATPVPFAVLDRSMAGAVVAPILRIEAYASVVFAMVLFTVTRAAARRAAALGQGSVLSTNMLLCLAALFCTILGYFAVQPLMAQARAGQGAFSFGALHAASTVMFLLKIVVVLTLAWRATGAIATEPARPATGLPASPPPSS